jgi:DNA repair protein RecO (recombination protein O)
VSLRVESESAFVLHTRPFRNTSLLVDLFTKEHGRITAVARSARGLRSKYKNIFRPFSLLWVNWTGRFELRNLTHAEIQDTMPLLMGEILYCGLYVNELLFKLLPQEEASPSLFLKYSYLLKTLTASSTPNEIELRYFEKYLLKTIGYGLPLHKEAYSEDLIQSHLFYKYIPKGGFLRAEKNNSAPLFSGKALLAFDQETLKESQLLKEIKLLMRMAIGDVLDKKKINARQLF